MTKLGLKSLRVEGIDGNTSNGRIDDAMRVMNFLFNTASFGFGLGGSTSLV